MLLRLHKEKVMLINSCVFVCVSQVPVTVANVSALPKTGGCLESTVNVMTDCVTNTTASSAQVIIIIIIIYTKNYKNNKIK